MLIGIILLCGIYELIAYLTSYKVVPELFLTIYKMFILMADNDTWINLGYSIMRVIIVLFISTFIGYFLGLLAGFFSQIEVILKPMIYFLTSIPTVSLILVLLIYTKVTTYVIVFLITFPLIYKSTLEGSKIILKDYRDIITIEGRHSINNFTKVLCPLSLPYLFIGLSQASALGLKVELMSEVFISNTNLKGIGTLINISFLNLEMTDLFGYTFISVLFMIIIEIVIHFIKRELELKYGITTSKSITFNLIKKNQTNTK